MITSPALSKKRRNCPHVFTLLPKISAAKLQKYTGKSYFVRKQSNNISHNYTTLTHNLAIFIFGLQHYHQHTDVADISVQFIAQHIGLVFYILLQLLSSPAACKVSDKQEKGGIKY